MKNVKWLSLVLALVLCLFALPAQAETVEIPTVYASISEDMPSNDELFNEYALRKLYGMEDVSFFGVAARESLPELMKELYDALKPEIEKIAAGNRSATTFTFTPEQLGAMGFTVGGSFTTNEEFNAICDAFSTELDDFSLLLPALLRDCPYEMYWCDYTAESSIVADGYFSGSEGIAKLNGNVVITLPVASAYSLNGSTTEVNTTKALAAAAAAAKAQDIVDAAQSMDDEAKLTYYAEQIMALVSYDHDAADNDTYNTDSNPWQLINVFDGNTSTNVVCEGYSKAFQYLCDLSTFDDAEVYTVSGDMAAPDESGVVGAGPHMWNIVSMGGKNYLVDVTNSEDGTVGMGGELFMARAQQGGSVADGYVVLGYNNAPVTYKYDSDQKALWGEGVLTLAVSCPHDFVGGVCDLCGEVCEHPSFTGGVCTTCGIIGGYCGAEGDGTNLVWTLNDGTFAITGTGAMADYDSYDDSPWYTYRNSITALTIQEGVTTIGRNAFFLTAGLKSVTIPASVTKLGRCAFTGSGLETVTFADESQLTTIDDYAFQNCKALTEITLPAGVGSFRTDWVFYGCTALTDIHVAEGNTTYKGVDGVLYTADGTTLMFYPEGKTATSFTTPAGVTAIGQSAFSDNDNIESVTLSEGVTTISDCAFLFCGALAEVTIPASVTSIGTDAFYGCDTLTTVNAPCNWDGSLYTFADTVTVNVAEHTPDENSYTDNGDGTHDVTCATCGAVLVKNGDHTFTQNDAGEWVCACTAQAVAMVEAGGNTTCYTDFAEAVEDWTHGTTLTLLDDVSYGNGINLGAGTRTFAGGDHTLDLGSSNLINKGTLTINGGTITADNMAGGTIENWGELIINGNSVINNNENAAVVNYNKFEATGGTLTASTGLDNEDDGVAVLNGTTLSNVLTWGNVTLTNCTITLDESSTQHLDFRGGKVTINGDCAGWRVIYFGDNSAAVVGTDIVLPDNYYLFRNATIIPTLEYHADAIIGKHTSADHNYEYTPNDDGLTHNRTCTVGCGAGETNVPHTAPDAEGKCVCGAQLVAEVGGTYYADFGKAVAAWTDGTTLTLLDDVSYDSDINLGAGTRTFVGGKHTLTLTSEANRIYNDGTLTIASGTITSEGSYAIQNSGTLNIEGGIVSAPAVDGIAVDNMDGTLTITGGTVSATAVGGIAVMNDSGTLTITGGTVSAPGLGGYAIVNHSSMTLDGGTIEGYSCIDNSGTAELKLKSGTVTASDGYALNNSGTATLSGADLATEGNNPAVFCNSGKTTISGGTLAGNSEAVIWRADGTLTITTTGCNGWKVISPAETATIGEDITLPEGYYVFDDDGKFIANLEAGAIGTITEHTHKTLPIDNKDGKSHDLGCACGAVSNQKILHFVLNAEDKCVCGAQLVAKVDEAYYSDIAVAMDDWANNGGTMTLLRDATYTNEYGLYLISENPYTFVGDGCTLELQATFSNQAQLTIESGTIKTPYGIENMGTLHVKGGTIESEGIGIWNTNILTIENGVTVTAKYVCIANYQIQTGNVCQITINGGTFSSDDYVMTLSGGTVAINDGSMKSVNEVELLFQNGDSKVTIKDGVIPDAGWKVTSNSNTPIVLSDCLSLPSDHYVFAGDEIIDTLKLAQDGVIKRHSHSYTATADDDTDSITYACSCGIGTQTAKLLAPAETLVYNGDVYIPAVEVTDSTVEPAVVYTQNGQGVAEIKNAGDYTATINWHGKEVSMSITILPADIADATVTVAEETHTGFAITPTYTVSMNEERLGQNTDYTVTFPADMTNAGEKELTFTGMGNYTGTKKVPYTINKATPTVTAPKAAEGLTYSGFTQQLLSNSGYTTGGTLLYSLDGQTWSEEVPVGTEVGDYTVYYKVDGGNNYESVEAQSLTASIGKADADKWSVNVAAQEVLVGSGLNAVVVPATGTGIGSEVVQITAMALYSDAELQTPATDADISGLGEDESITLYYKATADNYEAATGPMTVKAIAHQHVWTYTADEDTDTITAKCSGTIGTCPDAEQRVTLNAPDVTYSGNPVEAEVTCEGTSLTYTLQYSPNAPTNAGEYTVTMTVGDKSVNDTFTINPKDISKVASCQFSLTENSFVYSGEAPALNVTGVDSSVGNYTMQENADYTVGTVQVNAGSHKLTITGKGNYTGTVELDYEITRAPIAGAVITAESQVYTGEALEPAFTVELNGKALKHNVDFTFSWTNNVNVGKGKIVINGIGNYEGQAEGTFDITSAPADLTAETYLGESQTGDFTYGDVITIKGAVTVDRQNTFSLRRAPAANEVALYLEGGNEVIAGPVAADPATGEFTMTYDTTNKDIQIGQRNLKLVYVSDGNKDGTTGSVTVTLLKKELTIARAGAADREYEKDNKLVAVTGVDLDGIAAIGDDVKADLTGVQGTLASDNAGDYTTMVLPKLELTGSDKDYYTIAADEAVPTDVTITKAQLVSVELPTDVTLDTYLATADQVAAKLPATVAYTASNGDTVALDAAWTCADFDATPKAVNTFTWTVDASTLTNYELSSAVAATGTIEVTNTDALPVVITATDDSITFAEQPYGVVGMFAVDANAGDAHYEVVSGDAVLNGATLTVNKVGEIVIRLTTEANGAYASAEATATLTVTKADPAVTAPAGLTATYGQTMASVELPAHDEGTWAWVDEAASVGDAGVQTHEITFTPNDTTNWNTLTLDVQVTVSKYNTQVEMMVLNGETETSIFTYGETVTVKALPQRPAVLTLRRFAAPKANQMALFLGDEQISEAVDPDENGIYTMTIPTADKALKPGDNAVTIKYVGTDNMEDAQGVVTVTLLKKKLAIVNMAAKSREYQPENQQVTVTAVELEGKLEGDDVAVGTLTARVSSANVGSYAAATLPQTVPLAGEDADYYEAEGDVEVPVPQKVNITQATPEPTGTGADAGQPAVTPVTEDGKTLADIPLSLPEGAYNVPGTIHWVDGDDTPVEEGKEYAWVFIPEDPNYAPVNGTVVIYPAGEAPVITAPTAAQTVTVVEGETGTMTVTATEAEKYQWYIDRNDGKGYVAMDGATAATYTTSKVNTDNDGFTYYCQVSNAYGESKSPVFTLKVKAEVDVPQTGDEAQLGLWLALMVLSLGGMAAMVMNCKRREN